MVELQTGGGGRPLPDHLKVHVRRGLDRPELLREQIRAVEAERDALLAAQQCAAPAPAAILLNIKGIAPKFAAILCRKSCSDTSTIDASSFLTRA